MISSLRDHEPSEAHDQRSSHAQNELPQHFEEERRPPVLAVAIAFIVLFWGALGLGLIFWPR